jgi:triacylglycerol lipase
MPDLAPVGGAVLVALAAAVALGLAAAGTLLWLRRRRWLRRVRRASGRAGPRHPVVLLHGLLGFDELVLGPARVAYFRGLTERLRRAGADVHRPRVARTAAIAARGAQLAARIAKLPAKHVNVIAHSMGGLDARWAIAKLGLERRVASLVTIGTPHRGSPLADLGTGLLGDRLGLRRVLDGLGMDAGAFYDLTTARMAAFNEQVRDARGVWYASVVAHAGLARTSPLLWAPQRYLSACAGPNDGLVPLASQAWGEVLLELEADHFAQIGWSLRFDAAELFEELLRELRARGF